MVKPDLRPMLAMLTGKPFDDPGWIFETKWDGFRAVAVAAPGHAALYSRNGNDLSAKYPTICDALSAVRQEAVFDGELVALDAHRRLRFQLLQNARRDSVRLLYCVFDLLYLDGKDLRGWPLLKRKESFAGSGRPSSRRRRRDASKAPPESARQRTGLCTCNTPRRELSSGTVFWLSIG